MQCPYCKEEIKDGASKCHYCGGDIVFGHKLGTVGCLIGIIFSIVILVIGFIIGLF